MLLFLQLYIPKGGKYKHHLTTKGEERESEALWVPGEDLKGANAPMLATPKLKIRAVCAMQPACTP